MNRFKGAKLESIASLIARVNENTGFSGYGKAFPSILPVIQNELARMNSGLGTFRQDQIESMSRINSSLTLFSVQAYRKVTFYPQ